MTTKHFLLLLLAFVSLGVFAQGGGLKQKKEQIKALKVAFLTEKVQLSTDEAEKFWPIYNAFDDKQFELRREKMDALRNRLDEGELEKMSDKEASSVLAQMENTESEIYQLRKKLVSDLRPIIGSLKILKLKKAEEDFNRKLLQQFKKKKD
ncbi:sensor of ECF-type sigma factor [Flavobacterium selenitireducens]|uniref:sensor of ECF-type sigma factor n=1 Tax=Flavobacterium selenitireducens TaxID=2722704 RepID=UPI00168BA7BC|nr:sensor of ECF-type sigma factor [Flavobacterium selenitireducens]MBD3581426.1 sensor of ECF-type sigma factor [Flavobacterium selenitireducens]